MVGVPLAVDTAPIDPLQTPPLTALELPVSTLHAARMHTGHSTRAAGASAGAHGDTYSSDSDTSDSSTQQPAPLLLGPSHGGSPVHSALRRGDSLAALRALEAQVGTQEEGSLLHSYDAVGATPLHLAAASDDGALVSRLLALGADQLWPDFEGNTALHAAAATGACSSIAALGADLAEQQRSYHLDIDITVHVDSDVDTDSQTDAPTTGPSDMSAGSGGLDTGAVNVPNNSGWSPMMVAAANGHAQAIHALIHAFPGADTHVTDPTGASALHLAARFNHPSCVVQLVQHAMAFSNAEDAHGDTPLHWAAAQGAGAALYALARCGANVNALNKARMTPLHMAMLHLRVESAVALVSLGARMKCVPVTSGALEHVTPLPSQDGWSPVRHDTASGTLLALRELQESAVSTASAGAADGEKDTTLSRRGSTSVSRRVGAALTLLHQACAVPPLTLLVEAMVRSGGCAIDASDGKGATPLHVAAARGSFHAASCLLVASPASAVARDAGGATPLHYAAHHGQYALCALLSSGQGGGCSITCRDARGRTPLHEACGSIQGGAIVSQLITELGAVVQCPDADGETPLHTAVRSGNSAAVSSLMHHSGNPFQLNDMGDSAWGLASLQVSGQLIRVQRLTLRGLLLSLVLTVGLSYFDIVSDVLVALELAQQNQPVFLLMVLGCIGATMCTAAVVAHRGRLPDGTPVQKLILAALASLQLLPLVEFVIDALALGTRVPLFQDRLRDHRFAEVVFESTPQALLQVFIVLGTLIDDPASPEQASESVAPVQFLSICLSIVSLTVFYAMFLDTRAHGVNTSLGVLCWGIRLVLVASRIGSLVTLSLMTRDVYGIVPALVLDVLLATWLSSLWTGRAQWGAWKHTFGWAVPLPGTVLLPASRVYKVFLVRVALDVALALASCVGTAASGAHSLLIQVAATCFVLTCIAHASSILLLPRVLPKADVTFWTPPAQLLEGGSHSTVNVAGRARRSKAKNALQDGTLHAVPSHHPGHPPERSAGSENSSGNPLSLASTSLASESAPPPSPQGPRKHTTSWGASASSPSAARARALHAVRVARNPMLRSLEPFQGGAAAQRTRQRQLHATVLQQQSKHL